MPGVRAPVDPEESGWTLIGPAPKLGPGWRVYKKPRPKPSSHVDSLFIAPDGTKLKSLLSAQRHALQCDGQTVCSLCGSGDYEPNNDIVLCDGKHCGQAFHQHCLPEPLFQVPVGEWFCPDCEHGRARGPGLKAAPAPARTAPRPAPNRPVLHPLEEGSLRPSCIRDGCDGEARHVPSAGGATFECERCGTRLQSRWWYERLKLAPQAPAASASGASESEHVAAAEAAPKAETSAPSHEEAAREEARPAANGKASAAPSTRTKRPRDLASLDNYFPDGASLAKPSCRANPRPRAAVSPSKQASVR